MKHHLFDPLCNTHIASRIHDQLSTHVIPDITQFWRDVEAACFPMISEISNETDQCEVTFLWRCEKEVQGVYVRLNRITDKKDVAKGMMTHIPSTDIWVLTLPLPAAWRGSYSFIEIPADLSSAGIAQLGGRFSPLAGQPDPFNNASVINLRGYGESVLSLARAPEQKEWHEKSPVCSGTFTTSYSFVAGQNRRVRLYLPQEPLSTPLGLLVLPDAEKWFDCIRIAGALDVAINTGRIPPMAILGIDNVNEADRMKILGGNRELISDIAGKLIPQLREDHPDIIWAGRSHTVLAGQSLGGVTALMAALYASEIFGTVISHSPSMWWSPHRNTPVMFSEKDPSWVSEQVLSRPPKTVRIQVCVGSLEGATVQHVQQLHKHLLTAEVHSELSIYCGGHDYAWWRGAIFDGLAAL